MSYFRNSHLADLVDPVMELYNTELAEIFTSIVSENFVVCHTFMCYVPVYNLVVCSIKVSN